MTADIVYLAEVTMRASIGTVILLLGLGTNLARAQISSFQHVVVIFQENRTPDNLFQGLCTTSTSCSTTPSATQYNIQTKDWFDKHSSTGKTQPAPVALANTYDLSHAHSAFTAMCDTDPSTGQCKMDGAGDIPCAPASGTTCPPQPQFKFVDNTSGILNPYLTLATQFGFANYMFQTNQGPSFPAHQYIFGATSAPSALDDAQSTFAAENMTPGKLGAGCIADPTVLVQLIVNGVEDPSNKIFPCFDHPTVPDLLKPAGISWRYYAPGASSIWTAPNAISHICGASGQQCLGADFVNNVDLTPSDVLTDLGKCDFRPVTWVIPTGQNSDHAKSNDGGGPSWVASVVNAIGTSKCKNPDGSSYWNTTAILISWDDWGGWYDHESPTMAGNGYEQGFRVPLLVVSAYTNPRTINNNRHDFGSIVRFVEHNFGIAEGALNFADARAKNDLTAFFHLNQAPRPFPAIAAQRSASFFVNDKRPMADPDDD